MQEQTFGGAIIAIILLTWIVFGVYVVHRTRNDGCAAKIGIAILFTKGFLLYHLFYVLPATLIKIVRGFIAGVKEGQAEQECDTDSNTKKKK